MRIAILGRGPIAEPLVRLAERASHTVRWVEEPVDSSSADAAAELVILAGTRTAVEPLLARIAGSLGREAIVVDASIATHDDRRREEPVDTRKNWIGAAVPGARVVRAFASVPPEALEAVLARGTSEDAERLAVPLAGDDRVAKAAVATFMREIGVEPFDLGAMRSADVLGPGGALWGKALNPVEMLEAVGWLSGDG